MGQGEFRYRASKSPKSRTKLKTKEETLLARIKRRLEEGETKKLSDNRHKLSEQMTDKEEKLLAIIRKMDFGEVRIVVTDGVPTRIEEIKKSIKL